MKCEWLCNALSSVMKTFVFLSSNGEVCRRPSICLTYPVSSRTLKLYWGRNTRTRPQKSYWRDVNAENYQKALETRMAPARSPERSESPRLLLIKTPSWLTKYDLWDRVRVLRPSTAFKYRVQLLSIGYVCNRYRGYWELSPAWVKHLVGVTHTYKTKVCLENYFHLTQAFIR